MKITPIGIYGPYPAAGGATSCYLVESGTVRVALDFGSGSLSRIQKHADPANLDGIILTHLHFDHFCDVLPLSYMIDGGLKLYCPKSPTDCFSLIKNRKAFDVRVIDESCRVEIGDMLFEFEGTEHPVECYAVKVTSGSKSFMYTSDTQSLGNLPGFAKGCGFIICDCAGSPGSPHLTPQGGAELQKAANVPVIMSHLNPGNDLSALATKLGLRVISDKEPILW